MRMVFALALAFATAVVQAQAIQAVTEDTAYTYVENGRVSGPATQHVRDALTRAGFSDVRFDLYPWARAYQIAASQPNALIYLMARTPEREAQFKWVSELMKIEYHLYRLAARKDITVDSLEAARRHTVGVMREDVRQIYFQKKGFEQLVVSASNEANFQKLLAGRVDLIPLPSADASLLCAKFDVDCHTLSRTITLDELTVGLYMAFSRATDDQIVARLQRAYASLRSEGALTPLD